MNRFDGRKTDELRPVKIIKDLRVTRRGLC